MFFFFFSDPRFGPLLLFIRLYRPSLSMTMWVSMIMVCLTKSYSIGIEKSICHHCMSMHRWMHPHVWLFCLNCMDLLSCSSLDVISTMGFTSSSSSSKCKQSPTLIRVCKCCACKDSSSNAALFHCQCIISQISCIPISKSWGFTWHQWFRSRLKESQETETPASFLAVLVLMSLLSQGSLQVLT